MPEALNEAARDLSSMQSDSLPGAQAHPKRQTELDGVRGVAIGLVMLLHFGLLAAGWVGVQLFFVLSGFLITGILLRSKPQPLRSFLTHFYRNRALRIFPLYYLYVAAIAASFAAIGYPAEFARWGLAMATFSVNFCRWSHAWSNHPLITPLWSLAVEEQFYLVWPMVVYFLSSTSLKRLCWFLVLAGPLLRMATGALLTDGVRSPRDIADGVYWSTFSHWDAFAAGGLAALAVASGASKRLTAFHVVLATVALFVCGIANLYPALQATPSWTYERLSSLGYPLGSLRHGQHIWAYSLLNLVAALLILTAVEPASFPRLAAVLRSSVLVRLGRVSFGLYLCHWPVATLVHRLFGNSLTAKLLGVGPFFLLAYGIAAVVFVLWERRFLALRYKGVAATL